MTDEPDVDSADGPVTVTEDQLDLDDFMYDETPVPKKKQRRKKGPTLAPMPDSVTALAHPAIPRSSEPLTREERERASQVAAAAAVRSTLSLATSNLESGEQDHGYDSEEDILVQVRDVHPATNATTGGTEVPR